MLTKLRNHIGQTGATYVYSLQKRKNEVKDVSRSYGGIGLFPDIGIYEARMQTVGGDACLR